MQGDELMKSMIGLWLATNVYLLRVGCMSAVPSLAYNMLSVSQCKREVCSQLRKIQRCTGIVH